MSSSSLSHAILLDQRSLTTQPSNFRHKMFSATNFAPSVVVPERMTAAKLSGLLQDPKESEKIAVIDVRDDGLFFSSLLLLIIY